MIPEDTALKIWSAVLRRDTTTVLAFCNQMDEEMLGILRRLMVKEHAVAMLVESYKTSDPKGVPVLLLSRALNGGF